MCFCLNHFLLEIIIDFQYCVATNKQMMQVDDQIWAAEQRAM